MVSSKSRISRRDAWDRMSVGRLSRSPHVLRCLLCKELVDMMAGAEDDEYLRRAVAIMKRHQKALPEPDNIACRYAGCAHHEDVPRELALKMIELGGGDKPWSDVRGVKVSNIALRVREKDAPVGWDHTRQDVMQRHFKYLPPSAGDIYARLAPKRTTLHLWIGLSYASRREDVHDVATIEDVVETFEKRAAAVKSWCIAKYRALKNLAQADLELEGRNSL